jgi:uncharacterized heparinase superfamily protein
MSKLLQIQRAIAFGRHIPPRRIARRIALDVKRRWLQRPGGRALPDVGLWRIADVPPVPIFPPRTGKMSRSGARLAFTFLNDTEQFAFPIDWHRHRGDRRKQLWSMNLHYMEFLEGCDDATFVDIMTDWLAAAKPYDTGYWRDVWNSYAVSLRAVVWMQQLAIRPALPVKLREAMNTSLAGQVAFLARNLETDLGGNHLIKNIKALLWASAYFSDEASDVWRYLGVKHLEGALVEQILDDGMHFERSPSYHAQVFADLLECRTCLGVEPCDGRLDRALHKMSQVVADLAHVDGGPALFNDSGLGMCYSPAACLNAYTQLFGAAPSRRSLFALPSAGFFGLHGDGTSFIADCGPIGADALPAHAHGDVLSFEWSVGGHRVIVDPGVYEYVAGPKRAASRSSAAHNTLTPNGADQADFFADFRVGRRPTVEVMSFCETPDGFRLEGRHTGFDQEPGSPIHTRRFVVSNQSVEIHDALNGDNPRGATVGFLLHPAVVVRTPLGAPTTRVDLDRNGVAIHMTSDLAIRIESAVWWPDMGVEVPTHRLVVDVAPSVMTVTTRLVVGR